MNSSHECCQAKNLPRTFNIPCWIYISVNQSSSIPARHHRDRRLFRLPSTSRPSPDAHLPPHHLEMQPVLSSNPLLAQATDLSKAATEEIMSPSDLVFFCLMRAAIPILFIIATMAYVWRIRCKRGQLCDNCLSREIAGDLDEGDFTWNDKFIPSLKQS